MADAKLTALTENTAPLGSDLIYLVDDPAGSPTSNKIYAGSYNVLPDGFMVNGDFTVTVSASDLIVSLKTRSGGNPSTTDPVSIWLGGTYRRCTATLSKTYADGTNWANLGAASTATKEVDLFLYAIWNTTPGTDIFDIGWSRIPYGRVYSDFSGTNTNEKYLAYANGSAPTSTDNCTVIGRFAATLSAGAGYTWTVPTYTNVNFIRHPIYETRILSYTPQWTSSGTAPSLGNGTFTGTYQIIGRRLLGNTSLVFGSTTTFGTGDYRFSMPISITTQIPVPSNGFDSGTAHRVGMSISNGLGSSHGILSDGGATSWGQTIPNTWANGDTISPHFSGWL